MPQPDEQKLSVRSKKTANTSKALRHGTCTSVVHSLLNHTLRSYKVCDNCGRTHGGPKQECPAFGKKCTFCHKWNHLIFNCRAQEHSRRSVNQLDHDETSYQEEFVIHTISDAAKTHNKIHTTLLINDHQVDFKLDAGTKYNIMPYDTF